MELRSGRRLRRSSPPPPPSHGSSSRLMDLISSLPDEILLLVLARLRCVRTAAQTSLLSRRWRGLWIGLTDLTFRGLAPTTIEALFRRFAASQQVSTLDIDLPRDDANTGANSLLHAAVRLSPGHLIFTLQECFMGYIDLPCFPSTTSIELHTQPFRVCPPPVGEFTALESLSVTSSRIYDLGPFLNRCPRLRVLSVVYPDKCNLWISLPPAGEFPMLEKVSLSGWIVDLGTFLNSCQRLRELSITQGDTCHLKIMLPPSGEFPVLEKLSLSGNIADLGTLLNRCPRLRVLGVTFSGMALGSLEAALTTLEEAAPLGLVLSLLGIGIPWTDGVDAYRFASIFRAAARLSPQEFVCTHFTDNSEHCNFEKNNVDLPCFSHATSINMSLQNVCFTPLPAGNFSMLERLSLTGRFGAIVHIGTLVNNCPRLRVLEVTVAPGKLKVHSASLQKLVVLPRAGACYTRCCGIDIVTPELKELHLDVHAGRDVGVSISAPAVEKLTWQRCYTSPWDHVLRYCLLLQRMSVQTIQSWDDTCVQVQQLPSLQHVLCLHLNARDHLDPELNFAIEMEKLPVTNFFVLELNFKLAGHLYGAIVLQILRIRCIRAATKKFKLVLSSCPEAKRACARNCPCDTPKINWRIRSTFCTSLEEMEISGFNGEDHEHDFLKFIFKCSPMLKRLSLTLAQTFGGCTTKLSNIFLAHPSVNCYGYFSTGELVQRASG